jgi:hypothetical protein
MNSKSVKCPYNSPEIQRVHLDNEISLILASGDPGDPHTDSNKAVPEFFNQHPVRDALG